MHASLSSSVFLSEQNFWYSWSCVCVLAVKSWKKLCSLASCLICPSSHMWHLGKCWTDFHPIWSRYSLKFVYTFHFWLKALNHEREFMWKPTCSYSYSECSWQDSFQKKKKLFDIEIADKNEKVHFVLSTLPLCSFQDN